MTKVTFELEVEDAQELVFSLRATIKKIDYVLDNYPPTKKGAAEDLDERAKRLTKIATTIETILHQRALANANVMKLKAKGE
jgi:hypothetical protein